MPPKAKPAAKGKAVAKAAAAPEPAAPATAPDEPAITVAEAEALLAQVSEEAWEELADCAEPPGEAAAKVLEAVLLMLGDAKAASWETAKAALADPPGLLRELRALGPCSPGPAAERVAEAIKSADLSRLRRAGAAGSGAAAVASLKAAAKPAAKGKAAPKASAPAPLPPGAEAAFALSQLVLAFLAACKERPPPFPMVWPNVPFAQLHAKLQLALLNRQSSCVICPSAKSAVAVALYSELCGASRCDVAQLQVRLGLSKTLSASAASAEVGGHVKAAMKKGGRLVLLLGAAPQDLAALCDPKQCPLEAFECEKGEEAAKAMGLPSVVEGFHLTVVVQLPKAQAEEVLPKLVPGFAEMAVIYS